MKPNKNLLPWTRTLNCPRTPQQKMVLFSSQIERNMIVGNSFLLIIKQTDIKDMKIDRFIWKKKTSKNPLPLPRYPKLPQTPQQKRPRRGHKRTNRYFLSLQRLFMSSRHPAKLIQYLHLLLFRILFSFTHREFFSRNFIKSNRNQIVFTIFRLI